MIKSNFYHFRQINNSDDFILSQNASIPSNIANCLTNFQLSAIQFLFKNFETHKACILNDESGLGKTVSVSVFLNIILGNNSENRKCLIICKNEDRIKNWKFHLAILSNLTYKVVFNENEIDDHTVYLTKWESLRSSASLSNYRFDCILIDNRENLMANKICLAYLLRNYERKISLIISNQDVTIDLKEFHSMLRLCGRLEEKYRDYKVFEGKFELPLVQGCSSDNQKILESYFLRREKILNYCKEFCLRRFRHQYENQLPLVQPSIYRLNLKKWEETPPIAKIKSVNSNVSLPNERIIPIDRDTEDLHDSYVNKHFRQEITAADLLNSFFSRNEEDELNKEVCQITTTINDNAVEQSTEVMSPLVFIPDDSEEIGTFHCENENEPDEEKLENFVSSTTKDESDIQILQPTPIQPMVTINRNMLAEISKSKPNDQVISKDILQKNSNTHGNGDDDDDEPKIVRITRLTTRSKKDKTSKVGYRELKVSRILTRGQDRVTRSQAHKNKYLMLSMEDTIEGAKNKLKDIQQRKKSARIAAAKGSKTQQSIIQSSNKRKISKKTSSKKKAAPKKKYKKIQILSDDENEANDDEHLISSSSDKLSSSLERILESSDSNVEIFRKKITRKRIIETQDNLSDLEHQLERSETIHLIETTPELIVLSSSTDSSLQIAFNEKSKRSNTKTKIDKNSTTNNNITPSPDIFGNTLDESLIIECSQKTKSNQPLNITKKVDEKVEKNDKQRHSEKLVGNSDLIEHNEKTPRPRSNSFYFKQRNKITNYLKLDSTLNIQDEREIVSSSSSQSAESFQIKQHQQSKQLIYPKTPKKRKRTKSLRLSAGGNNSATKTQSSHASTITTPSKTSTTTLTKWLIKPSSANKLQEMSSNSKQERNNSNNNDDVSSQEEINISIRKTRSLAAGKKRRRLDLFFKD